MNIYNIYDTILKTLKIILFILNKIKRYGNFEYNIGRIISHIILFPFPSLLSYSHILNDYLKIYPLTLISLTYIVNILNYQIPICLFPSNQLYSLGR